MRVEQLRRAPAGYGGGRISARVHVLHRARRAKRRDMLCVRQVAVQVSAALRYRLRMRIDNPDVIYARVRMRQQAVVNRDYHLALYLQGRFVYQQVHGVGDHALDAVLYRSDCLVGLAGISRRYRRRYGAVGQQLGCGVVVQRRLLGVRPLRA